MSYLTEILETKGAADAALAAHTAELAADVAKLDATGSLLAAIGRLKPQTDSTYVSRVSSSIYTHLPALQRLMDKYGVELVPNVIYVDTWDLRIIGTEAPVLEDITETLTSDTPHLAKKMAMQACQTPQFKPGCY